MVARFAVLLGAVLLLAGCYLPVDFEADLNIDEKGRYAVRYEGDIIAITLLGKLTRGEVADAELEGQAAIYKRDLARDKGFKSIEHKGLARYAVAYERQGDILKQKTFDFIRSNARFFGIKRRRDGLIELYGDRPQKRYVDELIARGVDTRGVLRVWTTATVLSHNAPQVEDGAPALYQWPISSMRDPLPSMILELP